MDYYLAWSHHSIALFSPISAPYQGQGSPVSSSTRSYTSRRRMPGKILDEKNLDRCAAEFRELDLVGLGECKRLQLGERAHAGNHNDLLDVAGVGLEARRRVDRDASPSLRPPYAAGR